MSVLRIQHLPGDGQPRFQVVRVRDAKAAEPVVVTGPVGFPVEGRPNSDLLRELRWYLEEFLDYPFHPETEHADRVLKALKEWGIQAFDALFDHRSASGFLSEAQEDGKYHNLTLQIASDDPRILGWPWEALQDKLAAPLALSCQVERRVDRVLDPPKLDPRLPRDRVNILLVTARPFAQDVRFRSISRPLVELVQKLGLPAQVTVLRPPTFEQLRRHLDENPASYHVLHFDGHGGYGAVNAGTAGGGGGPYMYQAEGVLVFEGEDGKPNHVSAEQLSTLLREHAVPAVVLNACQSAMIDDRAADPFASVAAALLKSGMRSVVAMAYSLYVSGARHFVPACYGRLFESGNVATAVRAGRQKMYEKPGRICVRGEFPLQDWLVPVVYQQDPMDFSFVSAAKSIEKRESNLPTEARDTENPYGFIGRDGPILELERAMLRPPAGILIQGLGGVGKTTLARGFVEWLEATGGLGAGCIWFDFRDIRTAEYVINRIGESFFGGQFAAAEMPAKIEALGRVLKENRVVIVWDNFEVAHGIPETSIGANLTPGDRDVLKAFLWQLRGGASKVLVTSRTSEDWLQSHNLSEVKIGGLDGGERWEYCEIVLKDLGISPNRTDPAMIDLMDRLGGHPLAMRAILPRLKDRSPSQLADALRQNSSDLGLPEGEVSSKLVATLRFVEDSLPADLRPLLIPLGLHEAYVDADYLEHMAKRVDPSISRSHIDRFTGALGYAGLLRDRGNAVFELHPALTGYLRATGRTRADHHQRDSWTRAFVDVMGRLADQLAPLLLHQQRGSFHLFGASFHQALIEAEGLGMDTHFAALTQSLAAFAQNSRDYLAAERLFQSLSEAYLEKGDERGVASTHHQLGRIAEERRDFAAAESWYQKSAEIEERLGNEHGAAITYHQLGVIAQRRRDFAAAESWYRKSAEIEERLGNEHGAALTHHQLGRIAEERREFAAAESWYRKSVEIKERLGDEHGAASTYHQLGVIAQLCRDLVVAEGWYRKSVEISERLGIEEYAAITYHQLGVIAEERREFAAPESWYRKSVEIKERLGDEHGAAITYGQLGVMAASQERWAEGGQWILKALLIFLKMDDQHLASQAASNFLVLYRMAREEDRQELSDMWEAAGRGPFPKQKALGE